MVDPNQTGQEAEGALLVPCHFGADRFGGGRKWEAPNLWQV